MNTYECVIIVPSKFSDEDLTRLTSEFQSLFVSCGTSPPEVVKLEKKRFSHPIKKKKDGYYIILKFGASPEALKRIEENIRHNEMILRSSFLRR